MDLICYSAPLLAVGGIAGLMYPNQPAAALPAQEGDASAPAQREGRVMVARTRSEGELLIIFSRDGEGDDARIVPNGERAAVTAVRMIAGRGVLYAGDQLTVTGYDEAD